MKQIGYKEAKGIRKYFGLMFRTRKTYPLLFRFDEEVNYPIHSWFVFFDFQINWYDSAHRLIETRRINPFQSGIKPDKNYKYFIEIPITK